MRGRRTKLDFRTVDGRNKRRRRGGGAGSAHARRRGQEGDSGNRSPSTRWSVSFYGVEGCRSDNEKARKASVRMVNTEIGKKAGPFAKLQPGRARKRINATL